MWGMSEVIAPMAADQRVRHPDDPDPARSTKASAVLALGLFSALTGLFVGGAIPAAITLVLARQARRDLVEARGYLTGTWAVRMGERLAWLGIVLAAAALTALAIRGIYVANRTPPPHDFPPNFD